jgi:hypothetical protein
MVYVKKFENMGNDINHKIDEILRTDGPSDIGGRSMAPLAIIKMRLDDWVEEIGPSERNRVFISAINRQIIRLEEQINGLRDV